MQMMVLWHKFNISQEIWPPAGREVTKSNSWQGWGEGQALHCQEQKSHRSSYKRSTNTITTLHTKEYTYEGGYHRCYNQGPNQQCSLREGPLTQVNNTPTMPFDSLVTGTGEGRSLGDRNRRANGSHIKGSQIEMQSL